MKCRSFAPNGSEDVGSDEENVDANDDVGDKLVGQFGNQFVSIRNVVGLILKLLHLLTQQTADDKVSERLKNGSEIK